VSQFEKINQVLPNLTSRAEDPPVASAQQGVINQVLVDIFGQSAQFLNPILFRSGKLVIFVTAPVWATHIRHRQTTMMSAFKAQTIIVTEIKVKVTPPKPLAQAKETPRTHHPLGPGALNAITMTGISVNNTHLRQALLRLRERLSTPT